MHLPTAARIRDLVRVVPVVALAGACAGHSGAAHPTPAAERPLGKVDFPVSCRASAQAAFDHAVALLHHMTYPQARQEFTRVAELDPQCAMAHWGIAMTLFQPLWPTRPGPAELERGWQESERALSLAPATARESLFVAATAAFFQDPAGTDYWLRLRRWEAASAAVHAAAPADPEASAFYALALLATAPNDSNPRRHADRAAELLVDVYERNPDHPGAMHYLVHANDMPGREHDSLDITRKYETVAPRNPHALHMPTHIYTRLGDWEAVIEGNRAAAEAALEYPAGEQGQYVWDEFPHAIEYLVYAELQRGEDEAAAAALARLRGTARLEPTFKTAFHLASTQARYALEREDWAAAAAVVAREPASLTWDRFTWPEGISRFAQGLGASHLGRPVEARAAAERLVALEAATRAGGEEQFARNIAILRLELQGEIAAATGAADSGTALLRQAVDLERATPKAPVTPAPTLPAGELLGALLLANQHPGDALAAYQQSLALYPRRFNGLLGAARAAAALDDAAQARRLYLELLAVAGPGSHRPALEEAHAYLLAHP